MAFELQMDLLILVRPLLIESARATLPEFTKSAITPYPVASGAWYGGLT